MKSFRILYACDFGAGRDSVAGIRNPKETRKKRKRRTSKRNAKEYQPRTAVFSTGLKFSRGSFRAERAPSYPLAPGPARALVKGINKAACALVYSCEGECACAAVVSEY